MSESPSPGQRLDSWKSIAQYLQRDAATVRRWERLQGLPIHRVGLTGRSVFAYTREIDLWLSTSRPAASQQDATARPAPAVVARSHPWRWLIVTGTVVGAVAAIAAVAAGIQSRRTWTTPTNLRFEVTKSELIARTEAGAERWKYRFPATFDTGKLAAMIRVPHGPPTNVYFATRVGGLRLDEQVKSGTLTLLDGKGRPQRSFSFTDQVTFDGKSYGPPWVLTAFAVNEGEGRREVVVAAHHYIWDPGLVTILDDRWKRRGTFVHAGWIEDVRWVGPEQLLIAGFSNARDGGMIALLDATALDGQGPEPVDSRYFCENCGTQRPLRMFVLPRTELNRVTAARFNRARIQDFSAGRIAARTDEMAPGAEVVYEFTTPALDFVTAQFSDGYWDVHRMLEAEGRIGHSREQCPDRDGPRTMLEWRPATGWRTIAIR